MKSSLILTPISGILESADSLSREALDAAARGMYVGGEHVLGVSNERVPLEEGDLARSGGVSQSDDGKITAISYDTDYAVKQHEDESLQHDEGRTAKFLENTLASEKDVVLDIVARAIKEVTGL